jgi:hypothetical protein
MQKYVGNAQFQAKLSESTRIGEPLIQVECSKSDKILKKLIVQFNFRDFLGRNRAYGSYNCEDLLH